MYSSTAMVRLFLAVALLALFDGTSAVRRSGVVDEAGRQLYNLLHTNEHQDQQTFDWRRIIDSHNIAEAVDEVDSPALRKRQDAPQTSSTDSAPSSVTSPASSLSVALLAAASPNSTVSAISTTTTTVAVVDSCLAAVTSVFATNTGMFCSGWNSAGTTAYIAPLFQSSCTGSSYSRISSVCSQLTYTPAPVVTPTPTGGYDACYTAVTSAFPTNAGAFCYGWNGAGTTAYIAPVFQTACAGSSYARISSVCANLTSTPAVVTPTPTTTPTPTGGMDNCVAAVTSVFGTNTALFCSGWANAGTTAYVGPAFQTSCAGNSYSRISSACSQLTYVTPTPTSATPTGGMDNCVGAIQTAFPTNANIFCNSWTSSNHSGAYIAPLFQSNCAGDVYGRISSACTQLGYASTAAPAPTTTATPTGGMDNCVTAIQSAFSTNSALFCAGFQSGAYVGPAFQTSCAGNSYSRIASACSQLTYTPAPTTTATPTGGYDNCYSAVSSAFPTNSWLFCNGWAAAGTTGYIGPDIATSCAGDPYSRISSVCSTIMTPSLSPNYTATVSLDAPIALVTTATPTGGLDNCYRAVTSAFPTNSGLFCQGWAGAGTTGYIGAGFQTSCAGNSYSRISSVCSTILTPSLNPNYTVTSATPTAATTRATPTGGLDNCYSAITSAFPTNSALFCQGWAYAGTTGYVGAGIQTSCAGNSYSRISSVCSTILTPSLSPNYTSTITSATTKATPTGGFDNCYTAITSAFPNQTALFCQGWANAGTTGYIGAAIQTSCAGNSYSRISSVCSTVLTPTLNPNYTTPAPTTTATPTGGFDNCYTAISSAFPSQAALFCQGWANAGTTGYVGAAIQTSCAGNSYSRISSVCSTVLTPTLNPNYTTPAPTTKATPTGGFDNCYTAITSAFPNQTALFCQGWANAGTTGYIGAAIQTSCAGNSYSRISSVCSTVLTPTLNPNYTTPAPTTTATPTGGFDNCYTAITSSFPNITALFCQGWANAGTTGYIGPAVQTSCAGNSYSRISSVCSTILTPSLNPQYTPTTSATPTGGLDNCWTALASAFPTNEAVFCQGWATAGTTGYVGPAIQTACAGNSYSRVSSVCSTILTPSLSPGFVPTPTGGSDNCVTALSSAFSTSVGIFCAGFVSAGTTGYIAPAIQTSCAGNSYFRISSACKTITNPALATATSSICTTKTNTVAVWPPVASTYPGGSGVFTKPVPGTISVRGASNQISNLQFMPNQPQVSLPSIVGSILNFIGVQVSLITGYPIDTATGTLVIPPASVCDLEPLQYQPLLSRDAGKGGVLGDQKMFIFADTGISSPNNGSTPGSFQGFVSNSVAIDSGMQAAAGNALTIQDGAGLWANSLGNMRGFIPLTTGEQAYNNQNEGNGQRYAIWPESSIIPLWGTTALFYAPIIYCNVNYNTGDSSFPYVGSTAMTITPNDISGPVANRFNNLMWDSTFPEWGCTGGIRSWGPSGPGGTDGMVYIWAATTGGLLLARFTAANYADRSQYSYYQGNNTWGATSPSATQSSAYFITGAFSTLDIFWSPRHSTFIMVYQTYYADNSFYWRYLNAPAGLKPVWAGGSMTDFVQAIYMYQWSADMLLLTTPAPADGSYTYGGGAMQGYYDADDITRGGKKMLLTWTEPTGQNPGSAQTGYLHRSAEVDFL